MGTFKDISLYGSLVFPLDGEYAGGIIARSLAGVSKEVKKTKASKDIFTRHPNGRFNRLLYFIPTTSS